MSGYAAYQSEGYEDEDYVPPKKHKGESKPSASSRESALALAYGTVERFLIGKETNLLKFNWPQTADHDSDSEDDKPNPFDELNDVGPLLDRFIYFMALSAIRKEAMYEIFFAEVRRDIEAGKYYRTLKCLRDDNPKGSHQEIFLKILSTLVGCARCVVGRITRRRPLSKEENPLVEGPHISKDVYDHEQNEYIIRCYLILCVLGFERFKEEAGKHAFEIQKNSEYLEVCLVKKCWPATNMVGTMKDGEWRFVAKEVARCGTKSCEYNQCYSDNYRMIGYNIDWDMETFVKDKLEKMK